MLVALSGYGDVASRHRAAEAGFDLHLLKPVRPDVFGQLRMLVEQTGELAKQLAYLSIQQQDAISTLTACCIETCSILLDVANPTEVDATRERCIAKAKQMCDRVHAWIVRYPYLHDHSVREALADLIQRLPPNTYHHR